MRTIGSSDADGDGIPDEGAEPFLVVPRRGRRQRMPTEGANEEKAPAARDRERSKDPKVGNRIAARAGIGFAPSAPGRDRRPGGSPARWISCPLFGYIRDALPVPYCR